MPGRTSRPLEVTKEFVQRYVDMLNEGRLSHEDVVLSIISSLQVRVQGHGPGNVYPRRKSEG